MASYQFLYNTAVQQAFRERCAVAVTILAQSVADDGGATAAERAWAANVFMSPQQWGDAASRLALAANAAATESAINSATDATLQSAVNAAKSTLVAGNV